MPPYNHRTHVIVNSMYPYEEDDIFKFIGKSGKRF